MLKREITTRAGTVTHYYKEDEKYIAHVARNTWDRLTKPEKVKLSREELAYGRGPSKRAAPLRHTDEWIDKAWDLYQSLQGIKSYPEIAHHIAQHFEVSNYQGRMLISEARAKYILKGK